ncbi:hypothetical protein BHE74_00008732 [Ensete ventricosum]|nr:hypothetical protein BHE74_00008732 [Ensete ventricosum]
MCPTFKPAERAFAGSGPCALVRPSRGLLGTERELVWMSGGSELDLGGMMLEWWGPSEEGVVQPRSVAGSCKKVGSGVRLQLGGADLTCVRSAVRAPALPVHSTGYLCQVDHVSGPAVRGCDDLATRSAFVILNNIATPCQPLWYIGATRTCIDTSPAVASLKRVLVNHRRAPPPAGKLMSSPRSKPEVEEREYSM